MHIKVPERFKSWLTARLVPISDGEHAPLVKYICALLKHEDRPIDELPEFLFSRLVDFLGNETQSFIALLVETLRNESYLIDEPNRTANETWFGERSRTGEELFDEMVKDHEKPRSRSRSLKRSRSPGDNDGTYARTVKEKDRERYREYHPYRGRSCSPGRSGSPKVKRGFVNVDFEESVNVLQLENVQKKFVNPDRLYDIFKKFGKINDIRTSKRFRKVTITFSAAHEAQKAYRNVKIVFGSLPVRAKLFCDNEIVKSVEDKNTTQLPKTKSFTLDNKIDGPIKSVCKNGSEVIEIQGETKKMAQEIAVRKQELLDKQMEELNKLLKNPPNVQGEQKQLLMATINQLQTNIKNIQVDLGSTVKKPVLPPVDVKVLKSPPPSIPTKEDILLETKRNILKNLMLIELNLFTIQQQEYSDEKTILDLKKNVDTMRVKLKAIGTKEKLSNVNKILEDKQHNTKTIILSSVDYRPTQLLIHGYKVDDENQVVMHFLQFGNIIEYISDTRCPALVIKYKNRKNAETALTWGDVFQDRKLFVKWYNAEHDIVDTSNVKARPCMGNQAELFDGK